MEKEDLIIPNDKKTNPLVDPDIQSTAGETEKEEKPLSFYESRIKPYLLYALQFMVTITIYGIIITFALSTLTSLQFNIKVILAIGITFYFIKEELPRIINKSLPKPPAYKVL